MLTRHPDCTTPEACKIEYLAQPFPATPVQLDAAGTPIPGPDTDMILGLCANCDKGWTVWSRPVPPNETPPETEAPAP